MKKIFLVLFFTLCNLPLTANADWLSDIINYLAQTNGFLGTMKDIDQGQLSALSGISKLDQSQLDQLVQVTKGLTGTHQFGGQYYDAGRFNWGEDSGQWQSVLALVNSGGSSSALGNLVQQTTKQFPVQNNLGSPNDIENEYYRMQAQTTAASRASSQLAFDQLNHEQDNMQQLHQLIDTTPDSKSAADLNNRLSAENAMINLQQAKLLAVLVQQIAIDSQEKADRAKENAAFFDIK